MSHKPGEPVFGERQYGVREISGISGLRWDDPVSTRMSNGSPQSGGGPAFSHSAGTTSVGRQASVPSHAPRHEANAYLPAQPERFSFGKMPGGFFLLLVGALLLLFGVNKSERREP
jgi:hypothetical protein